ncbi:MAG: carboxypeptidase regulatory-like domain-containing protein [Anaerolineales bacterium]|nr:carboxypeptidase regulatory-like domain-containing protein [Anaerolineales bacterium]
MMKRLLLLSFLLILFPGLVHLPEMGSAESTDKYTEPSQLLLPPDTVAGIVINEEHQPVPEAVVRLQATENHTFTDEDGLFQLENVPLDEPASITAWAEGFFINNAIATSEQPQITIEIHRFAQEDNPNYEWLTSGNLMGEGEDQGCAECHAVRDSDTPFPLPVDEWLQDAHSQSAINPRFLTSYNGTDVHGNQSPLTMFIPANPTRSNTGDYNYVALAPDPGQPYFGPGYRLDFPGSAGNCGNCHIPGAAAKPNMNFSADVNLVEGVEKEGIFCDFCHKVWDVQLDPQTGLPAPDKPGVMSYTFRRPPEGHQFFAGPYDDVAPGEDTYSAIQKESAYCAPCHFGVFWDNPIYNSFGEWLDSPYSDPQSGQTCQDCHMPPTGATLIARADVGAHQRAPETIFSHRMPGAMDETLLQNAVSLDINASQQDGQVQVQVQIMNDNTGHHVPTDYPGRHLILLVQVYDQNDDLLQQVAGPVLPEWCGIGSPAEGYYAKQPGEAYAKLLQEDWTGYYPTVAYWNPNTVLQDNRISAFETASSEYTFDNQAAGQVHIEVRLFLRRSFINLMDWKDWNVPDILMEEAIINLE